MTRQSEKFLTLMEHYGEALEYAKVSAESSGTAVKKYEAYLEGVGGTTKTLKAAFEDLSQAILDSKLITSVVSILTWIVSRIEALVSGLGGLKGAIEVVLSVLAVINASKLESKFKIWGDSIKGLSQGLSLLGKKEADLQEQFGKGTKKYDEAVKNIGNAKQALLQLGAVILSSIIAHLQTVSKEGNATTNAIIGIIALIGGLTMAVVVVSDVIKKKALEVSASIMGIPIIGWIAAAIEVLVLAITSFVNLGKKIENASKEAKENACKAADEAKSSLEDLQRQIEEVSSEIEKLTERIDELYAKSISGSMTLVEKDELARLKVEVQTLKEKKSLLESMAEFQASESQRKSQEAIDKIFDEKIKRKDAIGLKYSYAEGEGFGGGQGKKQTAGEWLEYITSNWEEANETAKQFASEKIAELIQYVNDIDPNSAEYKRLWTIIDKYKYATKGLGGIWDEIIDRSSFANASKKLKEIANSGGEITEEYVRELIEANPDIKEFIGYLDEVGGTAYSSGEGLGFLANQIKTLSDVSKGGKSNSILTFIEQYKSQYDLLLSAKEDTENFGMLSADTYQSILNDAPELLSFLSKTEDGFHRYGDSIKKWYENIEKSLYIAYKLSGNDEAKLQELKDWYIAFQKMSIEQGVEKETDALNAQKEAFDNQLKEYKKLIDARKELLQTYQKEISYQKELEKKQQNVSKLEQKLAIAKLDSSAAGQARVRDLEAQLKDAQEDLDDFELDHAIEMLSNQLDTQYNERELQANARAKEIEGKIEEVRDAILAKMGNADNYVEGLDGKYATDPSLSGESYKQKIDVLARALQDYISRHNYSEVDRPKWGGDKYLVNQMAEIRRIGETAGLQDYAEGKISEIKGEENPRRYNGVISPQGYALKYPDSDVYTVVIKINGKEYKMKTDVNGNLADESVSFFPKVDNMYGGHPGESGHVAIYDGYVYVSTTKSWLRMSRQSSGEAYEELLKLLNKPKTYHTGGIVDDPSPLRNTEVFAKLLKGEFVSTPSQMQRFINETLPSITAYANGGNKTEVNAPLIEIHCDNVTSEALPNLKQIIKEAAQEVKNQLDSGMSRTGYKRTVKI